MACTNFYDFLVSKNMDKASPPLLPQSYQARGDKRFLSAQEVMMVYKNWTITVFGLCKAINEERALATLQEINEQYHFINVLTEINEDLQWPEYVSCKPTNTPCVDEVDDIQHLLNRNSTTGFKLVKFKKPQAQYHYAIVIHAYRAVLDIESAKRILTEFNWSYVGQSSGMESVALPFSLLQSESGETTLKTMSLSQAQLKDTSIFPYGAQIGNDPGIYFEDSSRLIFEVSSQDFPQVDEEFAERFNQSSLIQGCNLMLAAALAYFFEDLQPIAKFQFETLYELDGNCTTEGKLGCNTLFNMIFIQGDIRTTLWEIVTNLSCQASSRQQDSKVCHQNLILNRDLSIVNTADDVSLASFNDYDLEIKEITDPISRMIFFTVQQEQNFDLLDIFQVCRISEEKYIVLQNVKKQFATIENNLKIRELWYMILRIVKQQQKAIGNITVHDFVQIITNFNKQNNGFLK